ncbi:MAG: hypothetical protein BGO70_13025 [Bacteroidetes bacterium 43-93]|nr:hypothetical protein [Bacteroidota bacterium]OJW99362.1 MAG: hypothetical protein BGO70_13025 [Bacteroidetes bacterium 43-93]
MPVLIILPFDNSTVFLREITSYIKNKIDKAKFSIFYVDPTHESHLKCKNEIAELPKNSTIIFLGHGSSYSLHGAKDEKFELKNFISSREDQVLFQSQKLFLLSCYSIEFLKRLDKRYLVAGIGFGNLPTEWDEILAERELDASAYADITENILKEFKKLLINIIKFSLVEAFSEDHSFGDLYLRIRLRLNKNITSLLLSKVKQDQILARFLYNIKTDFYFLGNPFAHFNPILK